MNEKQIIMKQIEDLQSNQEQVAFGAISELKRAGQAAVPVLIDALDKPGALRTMATIVLGEIGASAKEAIPALSKLLYEPHEETQMAVALTLFRIGQDSLPALLEVAHQADGQPCFWAIWSIAMIKPAKVDPQMVAVLKQEQEQPFSMFTEISAQEALGKVIAAELSKKDSDPS